MTQIFERNPAAMSSEVGGQLVLMQGATGQMHRLNETGRLLWDALPASSSELTAQLEAKYGLSRSAAAADVEQWLSDLLQRSLIVPAT